MKTEISLVKLVESGAHFGHQMRRWNPQMREFMHDVKDNTFIFDLVKTKSYLNSALEFIFDEVKKGHKILIVGTKKQFKNEVKTMARESGIYFITERWLGGTFTNFGEIKRSLTQMTDQKKKLAAGEYKEYTKKERLLISRQIEKTERMIGGLLGMETLPNVVIVLDTTKEGTVVRESLKLNIPIVGLVDSNGDPRQIDYPIPMNDDATNAVSYLLELIKATILEARGESLKSLETKSAKKAKVKPKKAKKDGN